MSEENKKEKEVFTFTAHNPSEKVVSAIKQLAEEREDVEIQLVEVPGDGDEKIVLESKCDKCEIKIDELGTMEEKMEQVKCPVDGAKGEASSEPAPESSEEKRDEDVES